MKTIIHSDVHLRCRYIDTMLSWEEPYDKLVLLGDVFDSWGDTPTQNADAAHWLKAKLEDPRNVCLLGNHDLPQMFPRNSHAMCSGFTRAKSEAVRKVITQLDFKKLRPCYVAHGILFSHAGFSRDWFEMMTRKGYIVPTEYTAESIAAWVDELWPSILERYSVGQGHPLLQAGYDRGGDQEVGGCTWDDFSNHVPVEFVRQILGHSVCADGPMFRLMDIHGEPFYRHARDISLFGPEQFAGSWSLDIDTNSKNYVVIEDNILRVKFVNWERKSGEDTFTVTPGETICEVDLSEAGA